MKKPVGICSERVAIIGNVWLLIATLYLYELMEALARLMFALIFPLSMYSIMFFAQFFKLSKNNGLNVPHSPLIIIVNAESKPYASL